jgi:hypothetical protein
LVCDFSIGKRIVFGPQRMIWQVPQRSADPNRKRTLLLDFTKVLTGMKRCNDLTPLVCMQAVLSTIGWY